MKGQQKAILTAENIFFYPGVSLFSRNYYEFLQLHLSVVFLKNTFQPELQLLTEVPAFLSFLNPRINSIQNNTLVARHARIKY